MFGVEEKGPGQCSAANNLMQKIQCVCEEEKKASFRTRGGRGGRGGGRLDNSTASMGVKVTESIIS